MWLTLPASPLNAVGKSPAFKLDGMKASGDVADLSDRLIHQAGEVVQLSGVAGSFAIEVACKSLHSKRCTENMLAEVIMHFLADPPLLAISSIQKRMLQELHFGQIPDHQKMTLGLAGNLHAQISTRTSFASLRLAGGPRSVLPTIRDADARAPSKLPSGAMQR